MGGKIACELSNLIGIPHVPYELESVATFAAKARSGFYANPEDRKTMFAHDAVQRMAERDPEAADLWLGKLAAVSQNAIDEIVNQIPPQRLSPISKEFTLKLLEINQRRLLDRSS